MARDAADAASVEEVARGTIEYRDFDLEGRPPEPFPALPKLPDGTARSTARGSALSGAPNLRSPSGLNGTQLIHYPARVGAGCAADPQTSDVSRGERRGFARRTSFSGGRVLSRLAVSEFAKRLCLTVVGNG